MVVPSFDTTVWVTTAGPGILGSFDVGPEGAERRLYQGRARSRCHLPSGEEDRLMASETNEKDSILPARYETASVPPNWRVDPSPRGRRMPMAEEKKPKIDLKARLGKKTVSAPTGGAVPPPVGLPRQVPAPPFATANRPKVDASNPYAAISADQAPKRAEPAAIKVEMSQEVVEAQKKGRSRVIALAGVTAVLGGFIGFAVGSGVERGKAAGAAVTGAEDLVKDVEKANEQAEALAEILKSAQGKLKDNKYPAEEVQKLGGVDIGFSGANLTGKGIGRFKPEVVNLLISFAS